MAIETPDEDPGAVVIPPRVPPAATGEHAPAGLLADGTAASARLFAPEVQ